MTSLKRLSGMRTYLVGAMDRIPCGGTVWRNKIMPHLSALNISVINPCDHPLEQVSVRDSITDLKQSGNFADIRKQFGQIRNIDLRCVDVCDFIIAHVDVNVHACGTYEEIVTANRQKKPVLIWCEQGKSQAPNWLFFMLPHEHIFDNMDALLEYLNQINSQNDILDLDRWIFL